MRVSHGVVSRRDQAFSMSSQMLERREAGRAMLHSVSAMIGETATAALNASTHAHDGRFGHVLTRYNLLLQFDRRLFKSEQHAEASESPRLTRHGHLNV